MSKIDLINKAFDKGIDDENHNVVNDAVNEILSDLNLGKIRVAEKTNGVWEVNEYVKKAILLSFRLNQNKCILGAIYKD